MKQKWTMYACTLILGIIMLQSCTEDTCKVKQTYTKYIPIYESIDSIRNLAIRAENPRELNNIGKIYFYNDYARLLK